MSKIFSLDSSEKLLVIIGIIFKISYYLEWGEMKWMVI